MFWWKLHKEVDRQVLQFIVFGILDIHISEFVER